MADNEVVKVRRLTRWQRIGVAMLVLVVIGLGGGAFFVWSGYYNVGANRAHLDVTTWLLTVVRDQSIHAHSESIEPPEFDADMIRLGAEHYRTNCAECHAMPGEEISPVYDAMLPRPPPLLRAKDDYDSGGLFWIIASGLKYTGMPAWPAEARPDEVWSVVAYLDSLEPQTEQFPARTAPEPPMPAQRDAEGLTLAAAENCVRCHGDDRTPPASNLVPRLDLLDPSYMSRALKEYRSGVRNSGIMAPIAYHMTDEEIAELTEYYAAMTMPAADADFDPQLVATGEKIAMEGVPSEDIPSCDSCHGSGRDPAFPALAGQSARYMATQLKLWAANNRNGSAYNQIMAVAGNRLELEQILAVSAYYASLPAAEDEAAR